LNPKTKEPEFLTFDCGYRPPENCPAKRTEKYIKEVLRLDDFVASNGTRAAFEASTHIVRRGDDLAPRMLELMPWLKIMVLLREPISRAASMLVHLKDVGHEGCLMTRPLGDCLLEESQIQGAPSGARATNYTYPMQQWLEVWPLDQIHIVQVRRCGRTTAAMQRLSAAWLHGSIVQHLPATAALHCHSAWTTMECCSLSFLLPALQYEELIEDESVAAELRRAKKFVGVNMTHVLPPLRRRNSRRFKIRPKGWPMSRSRYEELIELVRPDVDALVALLEKHGKVDKAHRWKQRWQQVWDENLASCDKKGRCNIVLS